MRTGHQAFGKQDSQRRVRVNLQPVLPGNDVSPAKNDEHGAVRPGYGIAPIDLHETPFIFRAETQGRREILHLRALHGEKKLRGLFSV